MSGKKKLNLNEIYVLATLKHEWAVCIWQFCLTCTFLFNGLS